MGDYTNAIVTESFAIGMAQVKSEVEEFYNYAYNVHGSNGSNFMEIGTKQGGNFNGLCHIYNGHKISVDLVGGPYGGWATNEHPYMGNIVFKRDKYFRSNFKNVHMIHGNSRYVSTRLQIEKILGNKKLVLLYIDGDHTYEGVKADFEFYKDLVHKNGMIVFHDINDSVHHRDIGVEVGKFWKEVEGTKKEFNAGKHWAGIGVLTQWK